MNNNKVASMIYAEFQSKKKALEAKQSELSKLTQEIEDTENLVRALMIQTDSLWHNYCDLNKETKVNTDGIDNEFPRVNNYDDRI